VLSIENGSKRHRLDGRGVYSSDSGKGKLAGYYDWIIEPSIFIKFEEFIDWNMTYLHFKGSVPWKCLFG
jgi:hypothetical protein